MDAARSFFYANIFLLFHDTLEAFLTSEGFRLNDMVENKNYLLPLVRAEADFLNPIKMGDTLIIELSLSRLGQTSITLLYHVLVSEGTMVARGKTIHVVTGKKPNQKLKIPAELVQLFQKLKGK
jgi:YbgC/YbaW family acyl-CoA thioester hydrolase